MNDDYKDVSGLLEEDVSKVSTDEKASVADKINIGDKIEIVKPIVPIKPIRAPKFAAMRTMAEYSIPTPVTRKEKYLNVIAGGVSALPTPITREEIYLAKICGMDVTIPIPLTRYEMYLYKLAGGEWEVPTPVTRLEMFLYHNCGYEIEVPEPITREEIYWFGGQPQPTTIEGIPPLTFTAKRTGNLEDYAIYGNTVQSGTPTPDSPIEPEFVGDRTENLFDKSATAGNIYVTASAIRYGVEIPVTAGTYTVRGGRRSFFTKTKINNVYGSALTTEEARILELSADGLILLYSDIENNYNNGKDGVMLVKGSTAPSSYIPYGYKIPISSAGQTKNIYLGQVQTTRKIKKLVLTGEENWGKDLNNDNIDDYFYTDIILDMSPSITPISSHFVSGKKNVVDSVWTTGTTANTRVVLEISKSYTGITSADDRKARLAKFKSYLAQQYAAGTPVTVWYVLATPETGIVNEPLCRIGDYADSVDFSQAGVEIPVTAGENTVSVGTTIQPSNMMISYK